MLQVQLLGRFAVDRDGTAIALPVTPARLLAFLALHPGAHDRDALSARFWGNSDAAAGRANLRTAVWALRRALGAEALTTSRRSVALAGESARVDLAEIKALAGRDAVAAASRCSSDLLEDISDDWAAEARAVHRRWLAGLMARAADLAEGRGDPAEAAHWSRQYCLAEPFDEPAQAQLVRRLATAGDRAGAVVAAREFGRRLHDELGVRPGPALTAAVAELRERPAGPPAAGPARRLPLFGRSAELAELMATWSRARAGAGAVVVLTGEAGIGKTRLVSEVAARAVGTGARVATGAAVDVGEPAPLAIWHELASGLVARVPAPPPEVPWPAELGRLAPDLAAGLRHGAPVSAPIASPEVERLRIFDAVLRLVEWAASGAPVLLVAEDVHRADRPSLALCAHVGRRLAGLPVLLVLTRRDRPIRPDPDALLVDVAARGVPVAELTLGPLHEEDIAAIARSVGPLTGDDLDQVVAAADGNPLLAVERARAVATGTPGLPVTLRAAVRASGRAAPRPARDLLEALAVAGRALTAQEVSALGADDAAVETAEDTGLLAREGQGLRYRHALLADAARADLVGDRARRHEALAMAVESAAPDPDWVAAEVAGHLTEAGRDDLAGPRWRRAARHARSLGALEEAARFWAQAVRCRPDDPEPRLELAEVHAWRGRRDDYEQQWTAAIALVEPADQAAAWCRRGAVMRSVLCHPAAGLAAYSRALDLLSDDDSPLLQAQVLIGVAQLTAAAGNPADVPELLERAGAAAGAQDARVLVDERSARLLWLIRVGRFDEVEAEAETGARALAGVDRPDQAFAGLVTAACALAAAGNLAAALRATDSAVALTRAVPVLALPSLAARAHILSRLGRHDDAMATARQQLALAERLDSDALDGLASNDAGLIALAAGSAAEAARLLGVALTSSARFSRPASRLARAEALAALGDPAGAAAEVRAAALEPVGPGDQPWALVPRMARAQGLVALARGDSDEARRRLAEAAAGWRRLRRPETGAELMASLVDLGRPPVVGLVEPDRELARVEQEIAALDAREESCPISS